MVTKVLVACVASTIVVPLGAIDTVFAGDSRFARERIMQDYFAPFARNRNDRREIVAQRDGTRVLFRTDSQRDNDYFIFIPESDAGFQLPSPGSYIIRRRRRDAEFDQIKIFLQRHEGSFVRLRPAGDGSVLELFLAGNRISSDIRVPIAFERAMVQPFQSLVDATTGRIDWSLILPDPFHPGHAAVATVARRARAALPLLPDAEDGAMDAHGNLVLIEDLRLQEDLPGFNCSGFAKWMVDGLYGPATGGFLPIEPLKQKHLTARGTSWSAQVEDARDPYFGLDWTRNLARARYAERRGLDPAAIDPERLDVRDETIAPYTEDAGYPVGDVAAVLYHLAVSDPGYMYLGSINRSFGDKLILRQHTHVVVLLPYFAPDGRFEAVVLERNVETSIASLERRYGRDLIHLTRVQVDAGFTPPLFVAAE